MQTLDFSWPLRPIKQSIATFWPDVQVEAVAEIGSTNTELLDRARAGRAQPTLLVAERQSAGRGRMGRQWLSHQQEGGSLTFSLSFPLGEADVFGLSLVVGYVLAQALDMQEQYGLRVKWPNDLWYEGRKFGGVLIEICSSGLIRQAVVGVGINIASPPALPAAGQGQAPAQQPAWVQEFIPTATAPWVLEQVAVPLARAMHQFVGSGFAPWQARYAERDALNGQKVWLSDGTSGIVRGINGLGALCLQVNGELREVHSADISLRPVAPASR